MVSVDDIVMNGILGVICKRYKLESSRDGLICKCGFTFPFQVSNRVKID